MFLTLFRFLLFSLSMLGYTFYINRKTKIQIEFIPIITISVLTVGLFFGGLLNGLMFSTLLFFLFGLILFIRENIQLFRKNLWRSHIQSLLTVGVVVISLLAVYYLFLFNEQRLLHYDNFSHWAVIIKNLLVTDALPGMEDSIVSFNSYPPGSALFIYYFNRIVGPSEGMALLGQMTIMLSSLLTLFSFSSVKVINLFKGGKRLDKKLVLTLLTIFLVIYLLDGPSSVHNLLVDNLLTILGISIFSLVYYYFDTPRKTIVPLVFMTAFITLIKNSGLFFALMAVLFYGISVGKKGRQTKAEGQRSLKDRAYLLLPVAAPFLVNRIWASHVTRTFPLEQLGKHTMGLGNYLATFREKSLSEIETITRNFLETMWNQYALQVLLLLVILVGFSLFYYVMNQRIQKKILTLSVIVFATFVFYNVGLWLMYLVSMPLGEALSLAGYSRYMNTIVNYLIGISVAAIIYELAEDQSVLLYKRTALLLGVALMYVAISSQSFQNTRTVFTRQKIDTDSIQRVVWQIEDSLAHLDANPLLSTAENGSYYVYTPNVDSIGYASYYMDYRLYQKNVRHTESIENPEELWDYDYLSVTEVTEEIKEIFSSFGSELPAVGTYELDPINQRIGNKLQAN